MKVFALIIVSTLLFACSSQTADVCYKEYWNGEVGTCLPKDWQVIDAETMKERGVSDDAVAAFQSNEPSAGQFLTVSITKEVLTEPIEASMYSQANVRLVSALPGYTLIDVTAITIDEAKVDLHVFTAQPVSDEPVRKFYQISTVQNGIGYSVTGTSPVTVSDSIESQVIAIVQSVHFVPIASAATK